MMLKLEELMSVNLKGFKFNDPYNGMTMTSRHGLIDDYYIVIEDNDEKCVIANLDNRTNTKTWSKKHTASKIAYGSLCVWDEKTNSYNNAIEKL